MIKILETERLVMRPWELPDADAAVAIFEAPSVYRWLRPTFGGISSAEEMASMIQTWRLETAAAADCRGHWAVLTRDGHELVGACSLQLVPAGGDNLTLGWALAPDAWGKGYAAEAGAALARWAIHEGGIPEVFAILQHDNERAAMSARGMGMELVTELGGDGHYQVYRIRHGDLGAE